MYSFFIYFETLIFMTFYVLFKTVQNFLRVVGDSAEWYARRSVHWWQFHKVTQLIEEEFGKHQELAKKEKLVKKSKKGAKS